MFIFKISYYNLFTVINFFTRNFLKNGANMKRNPIDQFMKDPDNKAKIFIWMTRAMIITTFMITIGVILFILYLIGVI
ncbi:hypothetical protein SAMN05216439_1582 [Methanobrevibacter gottschalkii]|uniref:Uncharacterized protein n=2 Tax=Methanobrevibacter gottschalkii TaxID=190974 RepID=A0A3N5AZQ9_9EURY|nr:hypothetical protein EDC42_1732 [Methanobrevibacter gottschalkii DSM 11977]SEK86163.1 hypothetical protein SAMN05216439_1582 [Methanobrevibacter gottschalkii]